MNKTILYCMALAMGSALVAGEAEPKIVKLIHNHDMILKFPYESVPKNGPWVHRSPVDVGELALQHISPNWGDAGVRHEVTTLNPDGTHTTLLSVYPQCSTRFSGSTWSARCDGLYTAHKVLQASVEPKYTWRQLWNMSDAISKRQRRAHYKVYDLQKGAATAESLMQAEQDGTTKEKYSLLLQLAKTGIKACIAWYQNPRNQERDSCKKASYEFFHNKKWIGGNYYAEMRERNHK